MWPSSDAPDVQRVEGYSLTLLLSLFLWFIFTSWLYVVIFMTTWVNTKHDHI